MVRDEQETEGFDRETYEYAIDTGILNGQSRVNRPKEEGISHDSRATYLVKLEGPLHSASKIQNLAATLELPALMKGMGPSGEASFCLVDSVVKRAILASLSKNKFRPTCIRVNMADENLSDY
jgi:hypothetical protein